MTSVAKDIVLLIDKAVSGDTISIARAAAGTVMATMNPNDRVNQNHEEYAMSELELNGPACQFGYAIIETL